MIRRLINLVASMLFVLLLALSWASVGTGQQVSNNINPADGDYLRAIASAMPGGRDRAAEVLNSLGFHEISSKIAGFDGWPTLRKIETAYLSAAEAGTQEAEAFLRAAVYVIDRDHSAAISSDSRLETFKPDRTSALILPKFLPLKNTSTPPVSEATLDVFIALERYVDRVPGGLTNAMASCCRLSSAEAYDILRVSAGSAEALQTAIVTSLPPPPERARLLRLVKIIAEATHATRFDVALLPLLAELNNPDGGPFAFSADTLGSFTPDSEIADPVADNLKKYAHEVGLGKSPSKALMTLALPPADDPTALPQGDAKNTELYHGIRSTISSSLPSAESPTPDGRSVFTFETMTQSVGGFGGVVFGAPLDGGTIKATQLIWVVDTVDSESTLGAGHFDVVLDTGEVLSTTRLLSEDVYAALEILSGRQHTFPPLDLEQGEGVGLASVDPDRGQPMVLHPALFGLSLGDAAAQADVIGYGMGDVFFADRIRAMGVPSNVLDQAIEWKNMDKGYYRIVDAPLSVVLRNGLLQVERTAAAGVSDTVRSVGYITFQAMQDDVALEETATPFYEVLPALMAAFPQFERLNGFARTFAIVRWATLSKAYIAGSAPPPRYPAQLYLTPLLDGSLHQSATPPVGNEMMVLEIDAMRRFFQTTQNDVRKDGAPEFALEKIHEFATVAEELFGIRETQYALWQARSEGETTLPSDDLLGVENSLIDRVDALYAKLAPLSDETRAFLALSDPSKEASYLAASQALESSRTALYEASLVVGEAVRHVDIPNQGADEIYSALQNLEYAAQDLASHSLNTTEFDEAAERATTALATLENVLPEGVEGLHDFRGVAQKAVNDIAAFEAASPTEDRPEWFVRVWPRLLYWFDSHPPL